MQPTLDMKKVVFAIVDEPEAEEYDVLINAGYPAQHVIDALEPILEFLRGIAEEEAKTVTLN